MADDEPRGILAFFDGDTELTRHAVLGPETLAFTAPPEWNGTVHALLWDANTGDELFRFEPRDLVGGDTYEAHSTGHATVTK